jgi:hypothetical protein
MIKGVQSLMAKMESEFSVAIRQHIYAEMQDFVVGTLRELMAKAVKHKKDLLSTILMAIIETCSDQSVAGDQQNKFTLRSSELSTSSTKLSAKKGKKGVTAEAGSTPDLRMRRRSIVPSGTQVNYTTKSQIVF